MRRSQAPLPSAIRLISGDVTKPATLHVLEKVQPQILLYCVSASEQSDQSYRAHYVDGLRHVVNALQNGNSLQHIFFTSSTRVYGQHGGEALDETTAAIATDFGGRRLLEAENLLDDLPCPATRLRLSGIYGPERLRTLMLAGQPEKWPLQNQWTNRIHRDDAAAFTVFLIENLLKQHAVADRYIVTDSCPAPQREVLEWLARQMGIHPANAEPLSVAGGKILSNTRMLATGFQLRYPSYREGYGVPLRSSL